MFEIDIKLAKLWGCFQKPDKVITHGHQFGCGIMGLIQPSEQLQPLRLDKVCECRIMLCWRIVLIA
jgi:hypothetical protein